MTRYLDTVSQPWTRADIERAIIRRFTDAKSAIDETVGGKLWLSIQELEDSVWILDINIADLLDEISLFAERSRNPSFWYEAEGSAAELHTRAVKRKLFNCTASVMALVEHARKLQREIPVPDYAEQRRRHFAPPGLHDFLQCLRNYNTHWRIAQANWTISYGPGSEGRQARFIVTKEELLAWDRWTKGAKEFINGVADSVDVRELFSVYRENVQSFYSWHRGAVLTQYSTEIQSYLQYKRLYDGIHKKYIWNMIISHLPKDLNPFQHIAQYLPQHSVERVLSLPYRSKEQVDAIISLMDMNEFCDDALRKKAYALFGAADEA